MVAYSREDEELKDLRNDARRYRWLRDNRFNSLNLSRNENPSCNYVTAKEWIERIDPDAFNDSDPDEVEKMKDLDTIWQLQIYPDTPIGFYVLYGASLDSVIDKYMQEEEKS